MQTIDIHIDASNGSLIQAGSARSGSLPTLTRNDSYDLRLRIRQQVGSGIYEDLDLTGDTIRVGIGEIDAPPTAGELKLGLSGATSPAFAYNATAVSVYSAISGIAGTGVTVSAYGSGGSAWVITSATAGSAVTFTGDAFSLFPTSSVIITSRQPAAANVKPQTLVQLVQAPAVFSSSFAAASTANVVTLALIQNGATSPAANESYQLTIGPDADGGTLSLAFGAQASDPVSLVSRDSLTTNITSALDAISALSGKVLVSADASQTQYTITFVDTLGALNVTTALTLDASGVRFARFYNTTLTMSTAELLEMFNTAGTPTITPQLEVEIVESGKRRTVYQGEISIKSDLLLVTTYSPTAYSL